MQWKIDIVVSFSKGSICICPISEREPSESGRGAIGSLKALSRFQKPGPYPDTSGMEKGDMAETGREGQHLSLSSRKNFRHKAEFKG